MAVLLNTLALVTPALEPEVDAPILHAGLEAIAKAMSRPDHRAMAKLARQLRRKFHSKVPALVPSLRKIERKALRRTPVYHLAGDLDVLASVADSLAAHDSVNSSKMSGQIA